jgi:prepilin-type N-terminal cleavage/methylation domain-containing protein
MKQRGFTLVEMLVTLVVAGLVSTLLWQALAQVARLETQLAGSRAFASGDALRRAWLEQALAGVMTAPQGAAQRFSGGEATLQALTTQPPWPGSSGPEWMTLELRPEGDTTALAVRRPGQDGETPALPLWRWPGSGRFEYLDANGRWLPQWPPALGTAPALPRAVRLLGPAEGAVLVAVMAQQSPLVRRQELLQSDTPGR